MQSTPSWLTKTQFHSTEQPSPEPLPSSHETEHTLEAKADVPKHATGNLIKPPLFQPDGEKRATEKLPPEGSSRFQNVLNDNITIADQPTLELQISSINLNEKNAKNPLAENMNTWHFPTMAQMQSQPLVPLAPSLSKSELEIIDTLKLPHTRRQEEQPANSFTQARAGGYHVQHKSSSTQRKALLLIVLLCMLLLQALQQGSQQIFGAQGWAYVLGGPSGPRTDLLGNIGNQLHAKTTITPEQYINTIIRNMTLDQKLGQMMLVQFVGSDFSLDLGTMVSQYNVGSVLLLTGNHNIVNKSQLTSLTRQIQHSSTIPMMISLDQEGGLVDRLVDLDGPRPSAARIAITQNPAQAITAGKQDAQDLSQYGINLQLAPVVDVGTFSSLLQQQGRTFGQSADTVTKMAGAYLQGLQQSGKVMGTLKHFPGLGSSIADPHKGLPHLYRTQAQLDQIDWAPYRTLISQGLVHAIMVTHEVVTAIDTTTPASLSSKLVTGVLRDQMGFKGVIMTDSLTMEGVSAYYTTKQAAVLAVEAGSDIIMGADTPSAVATMTKGIKDAISTQEISQQRIDQSVARILMLKYRMGLLTLPKN
jgi:beta-N-acetylhexosaminidase